MAALIAVMTVDEPESGHAEGVLDGCGLLQRRSTQCAADLFGETGVVASSGGFEQGDHPTRG